MQRDIQIDVFKLQCRISRQIEISQYKDLFYFCFAAIEPPVYDQVERVIALPVIAAIMGEDWDDPDI